MRGAAGVLVAFPLAVWRGADAVEWEVVNRNIVSEPHLDRDPGVWSPGKTDTFEACQALCAANGTCNACDWAGAVKKLHKSCNFKNNCYFRTDMKWDPVNDTGCNHTAARKKPAPAPPAPPAPTPPAPTPPTPSGPVDLSFLRYPQDTTGKLIIDDDDGYPTYVGDNNAEMCPTVMGKYGDLRLHCSEDPDKAGHRKEGGCKCGHSENKTDMGCYKCGVGRLHVEMHGKMDHGSRPFVLQCPNMTRRQILERAIGWVVDGHNYMHNPKGPETCAETDPNPHCPQYNFELVCNGYVDMAWYGCGPNCQDRIDCIDMEPGDHVHTGNHNYLFRKWNGPRKKGQNITIWQMGGGWAKANSATHTFTGESGKKCFRRKNLLPDGQEAATVLHSML